MEVKTLGRFLLYKIFGGQVFVADKQSQLGYLLPHDVSFDDLGRDDLRQFIEVYIGHLEDVGDYRLFLEANKEHLEAPISLLWMVLAWGVTYLVSQADRFKESAHAGLAYVYQYLAGVITPAGPPELFLKVVDRLFAASGPFGKIGITTRSIQCLSEIEIGLVLSASMKVIALVGINDMTQNSMEALTPLQLFWAKIYELCCGVGPCWLVLDEAFPEDKAPSLEIAMKVHRDGELVFHATANFNQIARNPFADIRDFMAPQFSGPIARAKGCIIATGTCISFRQPVGTNGVGTTVLVNKMAFPNGDGSEAILPTHHAGDLITMEFEGMGEIPFVQTAVSIDNGPPPNWPSKELVQEFVQAA